MGVGTHVWLPWVFGPRCENNKKAASPVHFLDCAILTSVETGYGINFPYSCCSLSEEDILSAQWSTPCVADGRKPRGGNTLVMNEGGKHEGSHGQLQIACMVYGNVGHGSCRRMRRSRLPSQTVSDLRSLAPLPCPNPAMH